MSTPRHDDAGPPKPLSEMTEEEQRAYWAKRHDARGG
jgi:hypothetical protein